MKTETLVFFALVVLLWACQPPAEAALASGTPTLPSTTLNFTSFNASESNLETTEGFRVYGPNADLAKDVEPEFLAVAADSSKVWVTLQENNGLAQISLGAVPAVTWVKGLGTQDFGQIANAADVKDDGVTDVAVRPGLLGFFLPDGIARITVGGVDYLLLANEGDLREYPGFNEEGIVENTGQLRNVTLSTTAFTAGQIAALSDMSVTMNPFSPTPSVDKVSPLYTFGGRSFSIRDASGALVWDSGNALDVRARLEGNYEEERSDEKSSEPESVTAGQVGAKLLAFVGLEKANAVAVYDVSNPQAPALEQWLARGGDIAPEGLLFVPAADSPSNTALLITSNEKSGTLTVWKADTAGTFTWASTIDLGSVGDSEITAYDPASHRLFTVCNTEKPYNSRLEVTSLAADLSLRKVKSLPIKAYGYGVNSVAVHHGYVAAAVEGFEKTDNGKVLVWKASTLELVATAKTGALPDMITFTPDGKRILTADEGEPSLDYTLDPVGSMTIIDATALQ